MQISKITIPSRIFGIDFSGARDAGNKIWIAKGTSKGSKLLVSKCLKARDLPNSGSRPEACLPSLVNLIKSNRNAAFGFDFPFGLPAPLVKGKTWEELVLNFLKSYQSPESFRDTCRQVSKRPEIKRKTDVESHTPFSPYNLRLYKQTYYGISKILLPLVRDRRICVVPFHKPVDGRPWILEICPASTLRLFGLEGIRYKGGNESNRENRRSILDALERIGPTEIEEAEIKQKIIEDKGGDALDSVIGAMATFNAVLNQDALVRDDNGYLKIEGYVYA
jgi:hypothetical protein